MIRRWLPQPLLSLTLILTWLLLANELSLAQVLLAVLLGVGLPPLTAPFWPARAPMRRPWLLVPYLLRLLGDILIANLQVARLVLGPRARLRPAFVEMPIALEDDFAIMVLASTVSLTPGSVSADLSPDRRVLLIHALDVADPDALIKLVKARYEAPLKEMFE